jgi:DNA-binding transcriptional LysR family regulator
MDTRSLRYFIKASETLNFTHAAKECYISQTAISMHIAKMEQELGYLLFERDGKGVHLTPAGSSFYAWADITLKSYDNAVKRGLDINGGYSGTIRLAFSNSLEAKTFMPELIKFREMHKAIDLDVQIISLRHIIEELLLGNVDAVVAVPYDFYSSSDIFRIDELFESNFGVAMGTHHHLAAYDTIDPELLKCETAIVLENKGMPDSESTMYKEYKLLGLELRNQKRVSQVEEVFLSLQLNDGIALVPTFYWTNGRLFNNERITFRPLQTSRPPSMKWAYIRLQGNKNPNLNLLLDALLPHAEHCSE